MRWLDISCEPCRLHCAYCGTNDAFKHVKSYEYTGDTLSLYECPTCHSLVYDLSDIDAPIVSQCDEINAEAMRHARYVLETGFSSLHVAMCALSALPPVPEAKLRDHVFVDIGAGLGMASYCVKTLFGMQPVTVEPSYTGKISHQVLGLDVHRSYFEHLPEQLLAGLKEKPCCLHLNSVVEHLVDPFETLRDMLSLVQVEVLAVIVPDGEEFDFEAPFINILPFLAPRDHRHLPTTLGMEMMFKRLGFEHVHVRRETGLLTAIGSRSPIVQPTDREVRLAETLLLENLLRHPDPMISGGGGSRLLPAAIFNANAPLMTELCRRFPYEAESEALIEKIAQHDWDDLPFHLGPTCYWLASDAMLKGRMPGALSLLKVSVAFADLIIADYPMLALGAIEFKWAALKLAAHIHRHLGEIDAAERSLQTILQSATDAVSGARVVYQQAAKHELNDIRASRAQAEMATTRIGVQKQTVDQLGDPGPFVSGSLVQSTPPVRRRA